MFKAAIFFLFFVCIHAISVSANDQKPDKSLSFTFNGFYRKDTLKYAECMLRNNTDSVFWILGYDTLHSGGKTYIRTIYSMQAKKNGKWRDVDLGFSGIGIDRFILSPGDEYFFETPDFDSTAEAIKLGIDIRTRSGDDRLRTIREIWTDEIKLR